jgi:hypothetical protein
MPKHSQHSDRTAKGSQGRRSSNSSKPGRQFPIDADDLVRRNAAFFGLNPHATDPAARLMRRSYGSRLV